jgi:hypothetical protein
MKAPALWSVLGAGLLGCGGGVSTSPAPGGFPGISAILETDLRTDLFTLAGDGFRGREAGTLDELKASAWIAERARAIGLAPAGDDGTYFQFWPIRRTRSGAGSRLVLDGAPVAFGDEVIPVGQIAGRAEGQVVHVGRGLAADLAGKDLAGKIVVADLSAPSVNIPATIGLRPFRYAFAAIGERGAALRVTGAAAIVLVSDATADSAWWFAGPTLGRGSYAIDSGPIRAPVMGVPLLWARGSLRERLVRASRAEVAISIETFAYPSVNVVARVAGSDPALRGQVVLFSGHQDHDGVRAPIAGDSIWNGADDNASVSVALLAIGKAFVANPGRRSVLFVWHGAEERGLLGSRWHAARPMVPRDSIVAVLNADMIGHNHPDTAALLGAQPPHRNSTALANLALAANDRVTRFVIDSSWDRPSHPEGWYFRSDHLPYARAGIPAIYFSTLTHPLYHTPLDEPDRIDIAKLARVTRWMYATGWLVATGSARPAVDPGFRLER